MGHTASGLIVIDRELQSGVILGVENNAVVVVVQYNRWQYSTQG